MHSISLPDSLENKMRDALYVI